ncbi:hypothetical protein D3C73_316010 [compost metagenome]
MTAQHLPLLPPQPVNWSKVAFLFGAAVTFSGWVVVGAQVVQRLQVLEERTAPLANGDLIRVQTDVAWIRQRLEQDKAR